MNKNVKIAKELVKLTKSLVTAVFFNDPILDGFEVKEYQGHYVLLWMDVVGKNSIDIFDMDNAPGGDGAGHNFSFIVEWDDLSRSQFEPLRGPGFQLC